MNPHMRFFVSRTFSVATASALLMLAAQALPASSIPWNISLNAQDNDAGIPPTYAIVGGNVSYNSNNPGLGTGVGATVNIQPEPTTTYIDPTALGLTSATSEVMSTNDSTGVGGTLTANALATANLATGSVGVQANTEQIGNTVVQSTASVTAQITDQLLFSVANATASTITDIGVTFQISGTASPNVPTQPGQSGPGINLNGQLDMGSAEITYGFNNAAGDPVNGVVNEDLGWVSSQILSQSPDSFIFSGVYQLTGASPSVPILLQLSCGTVGNTTCDFADTGAVSFDLPEGVTFTSASGVFLTQPLTSTPEPASEAVFVCGALLCGIVVSRRHNNAK
jgi:hypothetical protein